MLYDGGSAGTVPTNLHNVTIVCSQLEHKVSYDYQKANHFWSNFSGNLLGNVPRKQQIYVKIVSFELNMCMCVSVWEKGMMTRVLKQAWALFSVHLH